MKRKVLLAFFAAMSLAFLLSAAHAGSKLSSTSLNLSRNTNSSQGQISSGTGIKLNTTIGEVGISSASAAGLVLRPGYIKLSAQPGSVTSITAMSKSTGDLELSWVAPGLDGFKGDVGSGVYHIDYSTDPNHAFKPSLFQTEFATSVVAGATNYFTISGLAPNTTYYTKLYLGDSEKWLAEDSRRSDESTLANFPVNPSFTNVSACAATLTWLLPSSGASGYQAQASTAIFSGGILISSQTPDGLQLSLTLLGLAANTPYFFKVASLNWQGDKNFSTVIGTTTSSGACVLPVSLLALLPNALARSVALSWANPSAPAPQGVLVLLSTAASPSVVADGASFAPGQRLADGSIVKSTASGTNLQDLGLTLDTTFFYHLFAQYPGPAYSVSVSTAVFLDLPPMAPSGLSTALNSSGNQVQLTWNPVASNIDGSIFLSTATPLSAELAYYRIERATSSVNPFWVQISTVSRTQLSYTDSLAVASQDYLYRVSAIDSLGTLEPGMAVDTQQSLYVFSSDQVTRIKLPPNLANTVESPSGLSASGILIRAKDQPANVPQNIFRYVRFEAVRTPGNEPIKDLVFAKPDVNVSLRYAVNGGKIVGSGLDPSNISAADAADRLGMYWDNGAKYVKLFGKVDTTDQVVSVQTSMLGNYQIRGLARSNGVSFDLSGLSNKMITPNGDGLNDTAVFTFDNPRDSAFSGKIFDLEGATVGDMSPGPVANSLQWDGKSNGAVVKGGVYVYQIRAEDKLFSGTLVVIR